MAKKGKKAKSGGEGADPNKQLTRIEDLDEILHGGVPLGSSVLISGASGTGKTTMCMEVLCRGASAGENGVIFLTSETPERCMANYESFDFFDGKLVKDGKLVLVDMAETFQKLGIDHPDTGLSRDDGQKLLETIEEAVNDAGAKRLAIDSLASVVAAFDNENRVRTFVRDLARGMAGRGVTCYMTSEVSPDSLRYSALSVEDTLVDGVILLSNQETRTDTTRMLQVIKMRGTEHSRSRYVMGITSYGIITVPVLRSYSMGGGV